MRRRSDGNFMFFVTFLVLARSLLYLDQANPGGGMVRPEMNGGRFSRWG
jgi:hypothetical protein